MNDYENELYHHGILGQKWGVRRYQNLDGSLTAAGRKRYSKAVGGDQKKPSTKEIASIEKLRAKYLRVYEMYKKQRDAAVHDLYHDRQKFRQTAKRYADEVEGADKIKDPKEKEALYDFYINEDGFQDAAEDWYVENVAKIDATNVQKIAKEYNDAVQDYCNKIIDSSGDLNTRAALDVTGSLKGGDNSAATKLLDNKLNGAVQKWISSAVQTAMQDYGAVSIYEQMRSYKWL